MKCANCRANVDERWQFCPKCGNRLRRRRSLFDQIFSHFGRELEQMDKQMRGMDRMERRFEALDLSPFFRQPSKGRGFKIKIVRHGGEKPKVSVQTFGDVNREEITDQLKKQFGGMPGKPIKIRITPVGVEPAAGPVPAKTARTAPEKELPTPKTTKEPKTEVRRVDSRVIVEMELPGVRSLDDIRINEMQESVEVRAAAGDRGFFKILTKPGQFRVSKKGFKDGKLHLEFS